MMKIKDGFILRKVAGKNVVVAIGPASKVLNGMIMLNDTGVFCWSLLQKGCTKEDLKENMISEYGISEAQAAADIETFLNTLVEAGCLDAE